MDQQNREIEMRTEKGILQVPAARQSPPAYNQAGTLVWNFPAPPGKQLQELNLDILLTTVGAGMTTTRLSQIIKSFYVYSETQIVADIDQYTIDMLAAISQAVRHNDDYTENPRNTDVCRDPPNVATGASLYGNWRIHAPLPGKVIRVVIETYDLTTVFGAGMTGGLPSLSVMPKWTGSASLKKQYTIYAKQAANITHKVFQGAEIIALSSASDFQTVAAGLDIGGKLSAEEITAREALSNDMLRGLLVDGTASVRTTLLRDPLTNANQFCLIKKVDGNTLVTVDLNAATSIRAIILGELPTDKVPVNG